MNSDINPRQIKFFDLVQDRSVVESAGGGGRRCDHKYNEIISKGNLLVSWQEFLSDKKERKDIAEFMINFSGNISNLCNELKEKTYKHNDYIAFKINDPKPRDIHKASVRDRVVHHAIYRILYPYFDRQFIFDSYSCRIDKGTHRAIGRFENFARKVSLNSKRTVWVLKCDIRKFFANIDHLILKTILDKHILDKDIVWLLSQIIDSFNTAGKENVGLPLGNLTSQLLVNIYMNEFDQFVKRKLKIKYYVRYADDFIILHENKSFLQDLILEISEFLETKLKLLLHPKKVSIKTFNSGVDFLGWVCFSNHKVLRTKTKRRMFKRIEKHKTKETLASYLGMLSHGNAYKLSKKIKFITPTPLV